MRILMISQWFEPEPTFKGLIFARQLQSLGHEVEVVTGFPNYPGGKLYDGYRVRAWQREVLDGIRVLRVPLYPSHDSSPLRRILNYTSYAVAASIGVLCVRRPDVAYVYHPPGTVALPALVLKAVRGVPFVYDVQDLWPDTLRATGMVSHQGVLDLVGWWMRHVYRSAARVAVLSDGFRQAVGRFVPEAKVRVIRNWADEDRITVPLPAAAAGPVLDDHPGGDGAAFTVVFAGAMGTAQALSTVLEAAGRLADGPAVRFVLVGGGVDRDRLEREAHDAGRDNVTFLPWRPVAEIGPVLASADALLVHLRKDRLFEVTIPSKTQAYLLAGRPILMGVEGDAARLVQQAGAGLCFEPESAEGLASAVRELIRMSPGDRARLGARGAAYYREHLALDVGARAFEELLARASLQRPHLDLAKQVFDRAAATVGLLALSPGLLALALVIRRRLGSPVLFRQTRPGQHAHPFEIVKFRTMTDESDETGRLLPDSERLTRFGSRLRSLSLDELPELWNVLRGDMSLVGPRPLLPRYTEHFTVEERLRLDVRPGLTGWAQIHGRNTVSWDDRLALDAWYVRHRSLRLDLAILARSLGQVLRRTGVVVDPVSSMRDLDVERATG